MFKRYPIPGTAPATLVPRVPGPGIPPESRLVEYGPEFIDERRVGSVADLPEAVRGESAYRSRRCQDRPRLVNHKRRSSMFQSS